jgi:ATP-binding cassette subfamily B (MDR/TAP) protein 1
LPDYAKAKAACVSIFELFERVPKINNWESNDGVKMLNTNADVEFESNIDVESVEFTYPSRPEAKILKGLTLRIEQGQSVAFVGSSGCGKSTITQLIERFYDADFGQIRINNRNIKEFNLHWLRSQIGIVSQEPILFDMSIAENIAYGDTSRQVPMDEIIEASKKANIYDFISKLPNV